MLYVIGLGLGDVKDITVKGLEIVKSCDLIYLESYTSILTCGKDEMEKFYGKPIIVADRDFVEQGADELLDNAAKSNVAFLVVGDPFGATTHTDLILRAKEKNIQVKIIHNASIMNAAACCGLQLYSFGETISIPYWTETWKPDSFYDKISYNRKRGLHTLCLLDIKVKEPTLESITKKTRVYMPPKFMSVSEAADQLLQILHTKREGGETELAYSEDSLFVGLARVGHDSQKIVTCSLKEMKDYDLGAPLHSLILPAAELHPIEQEYIEQFSTNPIVDAPPSPPSQQNSPPEIAKDMDHDEKIKQIDGRLGEIDTELRRLTDLKRRLLAAKDKLKDQKYLAQRNKLQKNDWKQEGFPFSQNVREKLKVFGLDKFRSQQLETINVTLSKVDVILVAPTGGGKSLCYQLPAVVDQGVTLVVSPLISLMEDQLYALKKKGIPAEILTATTEIETVNRVHKILNDSGYSTQLKLLYVTPERMAKSKRLMSALQKSYQNKKLERIAIDEVHCCSVMGHDFRPDYKYLGTLKTLFPSIPIIGVTATASRKVLSDVQKILNIRGCLVFNSPFNRPNLFYSVLEKPSESEAVYDQLGDLLKNRFAGQSGIIYTFSVKDTETLVSELLQRDCKVRSYHAALEANQRSNVYQKWMSNEIQAVVATIAFGLGIDKPDVRFVIHHTLSKSMENFYQESGRCGRDGKYAESIVLYRFADMFRISTMTFVESNGLQNAYSMVDYCINAVKCRRDLFSKHFTEVWSDRSCGKMCDHCYYNNRERTVLSPKMDILIHYRTLIRLLDKASSMDIKLTALKLLDAWFHKGPAKLRLEVPAPSIDRFFGEQIIAFLIINDYLREDFHYTAYSTISYLQKGPVPPENEIEFQPSRIYDLPAKKEMIDFLEATTIEEVERPPAVELQTDKPSTSRKRRILSQSSSSDSEENLLSTSLKSSDLNRMIEKQVESKLRKILAERDPDGAAKDLSPVKQKVDPALPAESPKDDSDDVIILSQKDEIIEID